MRLIVAVFFGTILCLSLLLPCSVSAFYNQPESVVFDAPRNRYLVSNTGDGNIIKVDAAGNRSTFNIDLSSVRGIHILGGRLYVACNAGVVGFNLATGRRVITIAIAGRQFLNDITSNKAKLLYVSDTRAGRIYRVNVQTRTVITLAQNLSSPNGLLYDGPNNRLLVCHFRPNSPITAVRLSDGAVSTVRATPFSNLDGVTEDNAGRVYVSSWGSGSVYRYDRLFRNPPVTVSSGHRGPADIFYNKLRNILAVPNFNANTVRFIPISP